MIRCLLVARDQEVVSGVKNYIDEISFLQLSNVCSTLEEAAGFISKEPVELVFCGEEFQKEDMDWFYKILYDRQIFLLIAGCNKHRFALQYHHSAEATSPDTNFDKFLLSLNKVYTKLLVSENLSNISQQQKFIFVRTNHKLVKINLDDIYFFEGLKDYTKIYTTDEKFLLTLRSLKSFEAILPSSFIRVHRSYIVSFDKIESVIRNRILIGKYSVPISDSLKEHFFGLLQLYI